MPLMSLELRSPTDWASCADFCNDDGIGSSVNVMFWKDVEMTLSDNDLPVIDLIESLTAFCASALLSAMNLMASSSPWINALTVCGCCCKNSVETTRFVVTNRPPGHSVRSSTSVLPPPSSTSRDAHGSGTHAPAISPCLNWSRVVLLSCGLIETSPPPLVSVLSPWDFRYERTATSCVLPSCGEAIDLPFRSCTELMFDATTNDAPPDVEPDTTRRA